MAAIAAGAAAGESYWPMPLESHLRKAWSPRCRPEEHWFPLRWRADCGPVPEGVCGRGHPWAHLDIAGPAFNEESPYGFTRRKAPVSVPLPW